MYDYVFKYCTVLEHLLLQQSLLKIKELKLLRHSIAELLGHTLDLEHKMAGQ
jgi:hypothetical protein